MQVVEEMKNDMEAIVLKVHEDKLTTDFEKNNPQSNERVAMMQSEIIMKERKIGELEKKLRSREDDVDRLKSERDRLIMISNELRAELNLAQRRIVEQEQDAMDNQNV